MQLFRRRAFSASLMTNTLGFFAAFGAFFFVAQYLQVVEGLSPLEAGLWSLPSSAGFVVGAMLGPVLLKALRPGHLMAAGLAVAAAGFAVLTQTDGLAVLVAGSVIFALGLAPVAAVGTDLIVGSAPPEQSGAASGMSETSAELGGALGIAVLGSVGAAIYRSQAAETLPAGAPAAAHDTAGGAAAEAQQLGGGLGDQVLGAAHGAFTEALQVTALVSAGLLAAAAVLAAVLLRDARIRPAPAPRPRDLCPIARRSSARDAVNWEGRAVVPSRARFLPSTTEQLPMLPTGSPIADAEKAFARARRARRRAAVLHTVTRRRRCSGRLRVLGDASLPVSPEPAAPCARSRSSASRARWSRPAPRCSTPTSARRPSARARWQRVWLAEHRGEVLPPISVTAVGDDYAILDGHHRVSVARARGAATIVASLA